MADLKRLVAHLKSRNAFAMASKKPLQYKHHQDFETPKRMTFAIYQGDRPFLLVAKFGENKESAKTVRRGDYIVTGPMLEQYPIDPLKFMGLYNTENGVAQPITVPKRVAFVGADVFRALNLGKFITFPSPWGEGDMRLEPGDFLVADSTGGYYRIEASAFRKTYEFKK